MKTWIPPTAAVAMLLVAPFAHTGDRDATDTRGRYEGIAASANAVWVIDTSSGRVRKCTQEFAAATVKLQETSAALVEAAGTEDMAAVGAAAKEMGGACKNCHDGYRIDED